MKKLFSVLLFVLSSLSLQAQYVDACLVGQVDTVFSQKSTTAPGATFFMPIHLGTAEPISAFEMKITYDSDALTSCSGHIINRCFYEQILSYGEAGIGKYKLTLSSGNIFCGNYERIISIPLTVSEKILPGTILKINMECIFDEKTVVQNSTYVTVSNLLFGDVTGNGVVGPLDVSEILQYVLFAKNLDTWQIIKGDVYPDGMLDLNDGYYIQRYIVNKENSLPVYSWGCSETRAGSVNLIQIPKGDFTEVWLIGEINNAELEIEVSADVIIETGSAIRNSLYGISKVGLNTKIGFIGKMEEGPAFILKGKDAKILSLKKGKANNNDYIVMKNEMATDIVKEKTVIPKEFSLAQNYPNPFNPSTTISYQLPQNGLVTLKVYDVLGNEVATLVNEEKPAGNYEAKFDASNLSSGTYIYKISAGNFIQTKKMILMK